MKFQLYSVSFLLLAYLNACHSQPNHSSASLITAKKQSLDRLVGGDCECCEAWKDDLPATIDWQTDVALTTEPGERLEISGIIYKKDGKTPAKDILLYIYHTDAKGEYSNGPETSPCAKRHGHLRGWLKTNADGQYLIRTVRPASYPNTDIEQHIHPVIKEPGLSPYWIDEFLFEDDPNLTAAVKMRQRGVGGNGIIQLKKNSKGIWVGVRNIILGRLVEGY